MVQENIAETEFSTEDVSVVIDGNVRQETGRIKYKDGPITPEKIYIDGLRDIEDDTVVDIPQLVMETEQTEISLLLGLDGLRDLAEWSQKMVDYCEENMNTLE